MPSLRVSVDGRVIAALASMPDGVMAASVSGTRVAAQLAHLEVHGGSYPEGAKSTHLIWVSDMPVQFGQAVEVALVHATEHTHAGKTIDELFPDEPASTEEARRSPEAWLEELRRKPRLHEHYRFELSTSSGTHYGGTAPPEAHGFSFSTVWNWHRPGRMSMSLHTYTLEGLARRAPVDDLVREYIPVGGYARFKLVA